MSDLLERLQQANRKLGAAVTLLNSQSSPTVALAPAQLGVILTELLRVGEALQQGKPRNRDPEIDIEIRQYRSHLEQLRVLMPCLHAQLLTERARLEAERSHLEMASAWAEVSRTSR